MLRKTTAALGSTSFQEFGAREIWKRDPDYIRTRGVATLQDFHSGFMFKMSEFQYGKPGDLRSHTGGNLHWYTTKGMQIKERKISKYQKWYREALGEVQYLDGFKYPEPQEPDEMTPEENKDRKVGGAIPLITSGKAREFAESVESLRRNPNRTKEDVENLISGSLVWSDTAGGGDLEADDVLRGQPVVLYEVLLLLCAEQQDWLNVFALLSEMGGRGVQFRTAVAASLFEFVQSTQQGIKVFVHLRESGVRMHINTYYALIRSLDKIEEREMADNLRIQLEGENEVTGEMIDFVVRGNKDAIHPETTPFVGHLLNSEPVAEVNKAITELLGSKPDLRWKS
eukprot:TRINITY_DN18608_c0_g1_i1.p1 TRINITY_DN18608_c0_g1~~TRINITY_DN18608_c0_g1_i1.p1  ORF type:complete len:341 (+),score=61.70 TRINITY_DN18608_c0_g1_i1:38-1060(+)